VPSVRWVVAAAALVGLLLHCDLPTFRCGDGGRSTKYGRTCRRAVVPMSARAMSET
jgi:hypothetical protein